MSASFGFQLKTDAFATCADAYDSLITKVEFEIANPNEDFQEFSNQLEEDILKIKSNCKYLPPLLYHLYFLILIYHHLYQVSLQNHLIYLNILNLL